MAHDGKHGGNFDLHAAAERIMRANGFDPHFSPAVQQQVASIAGPAAADPTARDMRQLPWSSIDNTESRDLDQVEIAEQLPDGSIRIVVGIADVDSLVAKGSPVDERAFHNTTSVYTGIDVFPMLPERLSTDLTSLNEGEDRLAIAIETVVNADGDVVSYDVYRAMLHNKAKLAYNAVGEFLTGGI